MSWTRRREIPIVIYIVSMIFILFSDYTGLMKDTSTVMLTSVIVIVAFTFILGLIQLGRLHISRIQKLKTDWPYSVLLLATFIIYLILIYYRGTPYNLALTLVFTPINLVIALIGFREMSILYHGARARNIYSLLLIVSAVISSLYQAAIGALIPGVNQLGSWLNDVPNTGVSRAIIIALGIGIIVIFVRGLLGLEKSYLGEV